MQRVCVQVDPDFKLLLDKLKHEYCIKEQKEVSMREFTRIIAEDNNKNSNDLDKLMERLR
jgi:hypothetical protein